MKVAVEINNLSKYYGSFQALKSLTLNIYEGEIFGLLGPNGAGKTTTLLILATVIKPSSGNVKVMGIDVTREPLKVRRNIGFSFQEPKALRVDTVLDVLRWHGKICGLRGIGLEENIRRIMANLGLAKYSGKMFMHLSGGLKKKVEVAKILIQKPKIAIFDEPTAQVDVIGKHAIWNLIREMRDDGSTIIIATNDMNEAEMLCDRIAIIHNGVIIVEGKPEELKDKIPSGDILEIELERNLTRKEIGLMVEKIGISNFKATGRNIIFYINRGEEMLPIIMEKMNSMGIKIKRTMIKEPTLDDVFFYFTGRTLR